jgi:hypothetical protein
MAAAILLAPELRHLGLSESVIQAIGRWSSSAWKIYIRDNPTVRAEQQFAALKLRLQ